MATRLSWLVKVVRDSAVLVVVMAGISLANAQSLKSKKITFCCKSSNFEKIIDDLSKAAGVHFVYSSNKIQTSQQVTLAIKNKPLSEVLDVLSNELNVSFKIQEHYITVKPRGAQYQAALSELVSAKRTFVPTQGRTLDQDSENRGKSHGKLVAEKMSSATALPLSDGDITPYVTKLKPYVDPTFLKKVPIKYLKSTAKKLRVDHYWFVSAGTVVNDYSAGMEIQAGHRYVYVAFSPTWLHDDLYHGGLGIGTSLQLSNVFSLRPIYSYASMKQTKTDHNTMFAKSPGYQINTVTDHHQFKLMLQYDISNNFKLRAGPTFNQSRASTRYEATEVNYRTSGPQYSPPNTGTGTHLVFRSNIGPAPAPVTLKKFWVGWEASLSYRINFK
jgi:hypothetical protein